MLLLPLALLGCQEQQQEEKGLATTHPELAEEIAEDSVEVPYTDTTSAKLYDRYRITTEEFQTNSTYKVQETYTGKLAPLNESSHPDTRLYRTMLDKGLEEGVNFAGKYTVVSIGCGTACQQHYIIDRETGKVTDKVQSSMGAKYNTDSRLFILTPPDSAVNYKECNGCEPQAYVLESGKLIKVN
ncbi:hypothetical protein GCM10007389_07190 [Pontibacter akesuensis]|nr:hypothetical protein GCM10007389_07190 [Pontibacter akesuensis]